jgi:hypothetical protein
LLFCVTVTGFLNVIQFGAAKLVAHCKTLFETVVGHERTEWTPDRATPNAGCPGTDCTPPTKTSAVKIPTTAKPAAGNSRTFLFISFASDSMRLIAGWPTKFSNQVMV